MYNMETNAGDPKKRRVSYTDHAINSPAFEDLASHPHFGGGNQTVNMQMISPLPGHTPAIFGYHPNLESYHHADVGSFQDQSKTMQMDSRMQAPFGHSNWMVSGISSPIVSTDSGILSNRLLPEKHQYTQVNNNLPVHLEPGLHNFNHGEGNNHISNHFYPIPQDIHTSTGPNLAGSDMFLAQMDSSLEYSDQNDSSVTTPKAILSSDIHFLKDTNQPENPERSKFSPENIQDRMDVDVVDLTGDDPNSVKIPINSNTRKIVTIGLLETIAFVRKIPYYGTLAGKFIPPIPITIRKRQDPERPYLFDIIDGHKSAFGELDISFSRFLAQLISKINIREWSPNKLEAKLCRQRYNGNREGTVLSNTLKWNMEVHINVPIYIADEAINLIKNRKDLDYLLPPTSKRYPAYQKEHQSLLEETCGVGPVLKLSNSVSNGSQINAFRSFMDAWVSPDDLPMVKTPQGIVTDLMPHQMQALHFMLEKEADPNLIPDGWIRNTLWQEYENGWVHEITDLAQKPDPIPARGGIVADDMGLGKTLSTLSLIVATINEACEFANNGTADENRIGATLIIVPKSLLEAGWLAQIKQHCAEGSLRVIKWAGPDRSFDSPKMKSFNVVLTTYGQLTSDAKSRTPFLRSFCWYRIVLDEAHCIRNPDTYAFKYCAKLEAQHRWALTGTPIQNSLDDFAALLRFLHVTPFSDTPGLFKLCLHEWLLNSPGETPESLRALVDSTTIRRTKNLLMGKMNGGIPPKHNNVIKIELNQDERDMYKVLERHLETKYRTSQVMKASGAKFGTGGGLGQYLKLLTTIRLFLAHKEEMMKSEDLQYFNGLRRQPIVIDDDNATLSEGLSEEAAINIYEQSIACDDPCCAKCEEEIMPSEEDEEVDEDEELIIGFVTRCGFLLCVKCTHIWYKTYYEKDTTAKFKCSMCSDIHSRNQILITKLYNHAVLEFRRRQNDLINTRLAGKLETYAGPSAKVRFLLQKLLTFKATNLEGEPPQKAVVFTAWSLNLDFIEIALKKEGIKFTRLDGRMGSIQRMNAISQFEGDPETVVFLATIGAGGVGLNLTAGNHVFIMEPQWNPQAEEQAIDRVHRIGQTRPVNVWRLITKDSMEEQIAKVAIEKLKLARLALHRNNKDEKKEGVLKILMERFQDQKDMQPVSED